MLKAGFGHPTQWTHYSQSRNITAAPHVCSIGRVEVLLQPTLVHPKLLSKSRPRRILQFGN